VFQLLKMEISADGATVSFYINNTLELAMSADVGVGPDVVLYPTIIACGDSTASRTVDIDFIRINGTR